MKKPTKSQLTEAAVNRMVAEVHEKGHTIVTSDERTVEERIATVQKTLEILRKRQADEPKNKATPGLIRFHEKMLADLQAEQKAKKTWKVVQGPAGDRSAEAIQDKAEAIRIAKDWAALGEGIEYDCKVIEVHNGLETLVDKYGMVKGRVRRIQLAK